MNTLSNSVNYTPKGGIWNDEIYESSKPNINKLYWHPIFSSVYRPTQLVVSNLINNTISNHIKNESTK
jgi:hypothetical protein